MNRAKAERQFPFPVLEPLRKLTNKPSIKDPETKRMLVKLAGSMLVFLSASLHRIELLAKASIDKTARKRVRNLNIALTLIHFMSSNH